MSVERVAEGQDSFPRHRSGSCQELSSPPPAIVAAAVAPGESEVSGLTVQLGSGICVMICVGNDTMPTNLAIDPALLDKALKIGGEKTQKATVNRALREFIARRGQERLLDLFGKLDWDGDYDYKRERTRK